MRKLYILIIVLAIGVISEAQPQYWNALPAAGANVFPFNINPATGKKVQWIVGPGEFSQPSPAPSGNNITSIWYRPNAACNATYTTLTVRMATVSPSTFITIGAFYTGPMTTVRSQNTSIVQPVALTFTEIPLTTPFPYDPTQSLIIEVSQCGYTGTGFSINQQAYGVAPNYRRQYSDASSVCGATPLPTGGDLNVPAIGITMSPAVSCPAPTAQPTGLILTAISGTQINGSFTAAVPAPTNYLVVRYPTGAVPVNPVNGTNYIIGAALGTGTVISNTNATAFSATGLTPATTYDFYVYSFNTGACSTTYLTTSPLFGTKATLACSGPPTITCPANITVNNTPGQCGATVNYPPAVGGGVPAPTITYSIPSGSFFPKGTTNITATATSICGTSSCTFSITVVDNQPPTITCPANITVNNTPNLCSAVVTYPLPAISDNCPFAGGTPTTVSQNSSTVPVAGSVSCNAGGIHTDNSYWRAFQLALSGPFTINNVQFGIEQAVHGTGTTQPVVVNVYTSAGAFPAGARTLVGTQTFNIPNQNLTLFTATFTTPPTVPGNAILVLEVFTPAGSPAGHSFFIGSNTAAETAPSYISAAACGIPTPVTVASLGFPNMHTIILANGTVPNTGSLVVQTAGIPSGGTFPVGVTTNTFSITDASGNTSTCSFNVTVVDNQAPALSCPANIVRNTDPNVCTATFAPPSPVYSDNCAVTTLTWVMTGATTGSSPATGINILPSTAFGLTGTTGQGVTTVTYTAKDAGGNTTTCSFTVTVNDASIPVISGQPSNQFVCVGSDGAFTVTATAGAGNPLTYQWQTWTGPSGPWVNITGATAATLTLPAVSFTQNTTDYRVILTGRCSVVTSGFATLYVNALPTISLLASGPLALLPAQSLDLTAVVSPGGGTYQWFKNGIAIAGATGSTLHGLTVDDIGSYTCTYTDLNGCRKTSEAKDISGQASDHLWVYPVPNNGMFQVRFFNAVNENVTVNVLNSMGQKIYSKAVTTGLAYTKIDIDISNMAAGGTYEVSVVNSAGKVVGNKKISVIR